MNIIYIEDDAQDRTLVERYLNTTSHHLIAATRLEDLELDDISPDLILMDILIDGKLLGLDYAAALRSNGINCPIIAVTALTLPHQMASYKAAGFNAVIEKPFEIVNLAKTIVRYDSEY